MKIIEVEFTKIVGEGKSLGRKDGKVVFSYGVLPGEVALVRVVKEKKNFINAQVVEIKKESPYRIKPLESHYLECSPWQIIDYNKQIEFKKNLIEDILFQTTKETIKINKFYQSPSIYGYRTKIEYSFTNINNKVDIAFHKRGDCSTKIVLDRGCALIDERANRKALDILKEINALNMSSGPLKSLIIRISKRYNKTLSALFLKDKNYNLSLKNADDDGFICVYSNPLSSISSVDEILGVSGDDFITERICGIDFDYGFDCFFQNNIELFELSINEIKNFVKESKKIIDFYCGVGIIGIILSDISKEVLLVESNGSSINYARKNIIKNGIRNAKTINIESEKLDFSYFENSDAVILDPPRNGLHKNVIKNIMKSLPPKLVYLSCNPITQGRDLNFFLEKYKIKSSMSFDFYPNTPHMENLVLLERK